MTKGGPANASRTLNLFAYETAFSYYKFGLSSTMLMILFVIVLLLSVLVMKIQRSWWRIMAVKKYRAKKIISRLLFGILVLVIVIPILFPLYFVLISSFKNMAQVYIMLPSSLDSNRYWITTDRLRRVIPTLCRFSLW